jgi:type II secretory pathway pseudopilin PulG
MTHVIYKATDRSECKDRLVAWLLPRNSNHARRFVSDRYRNKGFTQTELLLVILITGIIPTITTPLLINHPRLHKADRVTQLVKINV